MCLPLHLHTVCTEYVNKWTRLHYTPMSAHAALQIKSAPWPVWLSWLGIIPKSGKSPVRFPVRVHARSGPWLGCVQGGGRSMFLFHIGISLPLFLPPFPISQINKYINTYLHKIYTLYNALQGPWRSGLCLPHWAWLIPLPIQSVTSSADSCSVP